MPIIERISGREILDSRGRPTVAATCELQGGVRATASVPSGASTGVGEALELRDRDLKRYRGLGCRKAASNISDVICDSVRGKSFESQTAFDRHLISLDGTANKSRLGANAILAASLGFARACAVQERTPLYHYFAALGGVEPKALPRLTINLFSGGKHAGQQIAIQDVLVVPSSPRTIDASLAMMYDIYQAAAEYTYERYGMRLLTADEGGLAPPFESADAMLDAAVKAIERAGYQPGKDTHLAVDVASSHFFRDGGYHIEPTPLSSEQMIDRIESWISRCPIASIEDGLAESDWEHWPMLCERIGRRCLVLGDDLLCTNPGLIHRAIDTRACNALLLKVNQIGTLTEAAEALRLARSAGWQVTISVRSGETEDNWAADLAVGWAGDQFKNGSITQSERLAKYNRLLEIEDELQLPVRAWSNTLSAS